MSLQPYTTLQILPVLFGAYHTDCLILDTPSWHLWGNLLDAPLSSGPDMDNFLLDAYCWYGRHYGSGLHPSFFCPQISILPMDPSGRQTGWFCILHLKDLSMNDLSAVRCKSILHCISWLNLFFQYMNSKYFQWSFRSERGRNLSREKWCSIIWTALQRSAFILQVLRPPWVPLWLRIM